MLLEAVYTFNSLPPKPLSAEFQDLEHNAYFKCGHISFFHVRYHLYFTTKFYVWQQNPGAPVPLSVL